MKNPKCRWWFVVNPPLKSVHQVHQYFLPQYKNKPKNIWTEPFDKMHRKLLTLKKLNRLLQNIFLVVLSGTSKDVKNNKAVPLTFLLPFPQMLLALYTLNIFSYCGKVFSAQFLPYPVLHPLLLLCKKLNVQIFIKERSIPLFLESSWKKCHLFWLASITKTNKSYISSLLFKNYYHTQISSNIRNTLTKD